MKEKIKDGREKHQLHQMMKNSLMKNTDGKRWVWKLRNHAMKELKAKVMPEEKRIELESISTNE